MAVRRAGSRYPREPITGRLPFRIAPKQECPLWVISGHTDKSASCPLYPRKADMFSVEIDVSFVPTAEVAEKLFGLGPWLGRLIAPIWEAGLASGLYDAASTG